MLNRKAISIALSATTAVVLLTGCGSDASSGNQPSGGNPSAGAGQQRQHTPHNAADIAFARSMIPHHRQAIDMAGLVPARSKNPQVIALARQIGQAQGPEVATMRRWLRQWGETQPNGMDGGGMAGMDHGGGMGGQGPAGMPGMMSGPEMMRLRDGRGGVFDRSWLQMMIKHHEGAVAMARQEQRAGVNPEAKQLAGRIIEVQQREIETMNGLLNRS